MKKVIMLIGHTVGTLQCKSGRPYTFPEGTAKKLVDKKVARYAEGHAVPSGDKDLIAPAPESQSAPMPKEQMSSDDVEKTVASEEGPVHNDGESDATPRRSKKRVKK